MATSIKVHGLSALGNALQQHSLDMQDKIARSATNGAAQVVKKLAIRKAPEAPSNVSPRVPVGNLKKNIRVKRIPLARSQFTSEHIVFVRGGAKAFYASRYGSIQEYGSVKHGARPFMRPALDQGKDEAIRVMKTKILEGVRKANK